MTQKDYKMLLNHTLLMILCVVYGLFFTMGKITLQFVAPVFFTGIRMILAGLVLLIYYYGFTSKIERRFTKKQWFYIFMVSLFGMYITNVSEFWGLQYVSVGKTSLIYCSYPIITALLSWMFFNETVTIKKVIGLCMAVLGFIPVLVGVEMSENISGTLGLFSYAEIELIIAAFATSLGWLFARNAITIANIDIIFLNAISMLLGGVMAMFHSYYVESWQPLPIYNMKNFLFCLFIVILLSNIICYNLHAYLLKKFTATYISFF